ncbi:B2 protein-like [Epargyreus clarus]|uniref:B2 protein-like n=1 Tax=Epargyreus clarus TaxID=520877 RepID=UPI003C2C7BFC
MIYILVIAMLASYTGFQANAECKDCVTLGKKERAMFRAHSGECLAESQVDPKVVESLLHGQLIDDPALRRHVYCVLVKCKVIAKDGKLQKTALMAKLGNRADGKNATKILENCADQTGDSPEDLAWNLFRCGYERKAVLFEYMPIGGAVFDNDTL